MPFRKVNSQVYIVHGSDLMTSTYVSRAPCACHALRAGLMLHRMETIKVIDEKKRLAEQEGRFEPK